MRKDAPTFIAGHRGLVGSALHRRWRVAGFENLVVRTREELDLRNQAAVEAFFQAEKPAYVLLAAAKVGGILANRDHPGTFIRDNLAIQLNVLDAARRHGTEKLLFLGSSCIYPKHAPQPMKEEHLLTGPLEPTNRAYSVAKIAGVEMCRSYNREFGARFLCAMPTNLYGPGDNFDLETSHVLAALIRKFHEARVEGAPEVVVWGTGEPRREFLHVDDLAAACLFLMENVDDPAELEHGMVNVGVGRDLSIAELAELIRDVVGYEGEIVYDTSKPDGTPRKLLDVSRMEEMGWRASVSLREGVEEAYRWFLENEAEAVGARA